ncbi:MAG: histidine phosphatase family protein [Niabella sp.]
MKHLILIRHAKTEPGFLSDFERKLTDRGHYDAPMMAKRLLDKGYKIDTLIASTAVRTRQTSAYFTEVHGIPSSRTKFEDSLYLPRPDNILNAIQTAPQDAQTLAIVSHNNGITDLTNKLDKKDGAHFMPTCGIAIFETPVSDWAEFNAEKATLIAIDFPKNK